MRLPETAGLAIGVEPQVAAAGAPIAAFGCGLALASEKFEPAFADAVLPSAVAAARPAVAVEGIAGTLLTPQDQLVRRKSARQESKLLSLHWGRPKQQAPAVMNIVF